MRLSSRLVILGVLGLGMSAASAAPNRLATSRPSGTPLAAARVGLGQLFHSNRNLAVGVRFTVTPLAADRFKGVTVWGLDPKLDGEAASQGTATVRTRQVPGGFQANTKNVRVRIQTRPVD
jgi:hypothetical protein